MPRDQSLYKVNRTTNKQTNKQTKHNIPKREQSFYQVAMKISEKIVKTNKNPAKPKQE